MALHDALADDLAERFAALSAQEVSGDVVHGYSVLLRDALVLAGWGWSGRPLYLAQGIAVALVMVTDPERERR
jgi:hypothetical protein